tara:strand:- start:1150 stop:2538 length:1389 start_codon:yes stop_codon:yes gene_type:complete
MAVREFMNPTDFSQPDQAMDLYSNSVRRTLAFNAFEDKTIFEAIILSQPYFLVDAQVSGERVLPNVRTEDEGRLSKFAFKARILGNPSPHDYLPDPCKMNGDTAEEQAALIRVVALHTTFVSSDDYTRSDVALPNVGDTVRVELEKNVHSYNLQFGKFVGLADNSSGATLTEEEACIPTRVAFQGAAAASAFASGAGVRPTLTENSFALTKENIPGRSYQWGSDWGERTNPRDSSDMSWHSGRDFKSMPEGTPAYALCDGTVVGNVVANCPASDPCLPVNGGDYTGCCGGGFGNHVRIKCASKGNVHIIIYAHLFRVVQGIETGTRVIAGMQIGEVGNTGSSVGSHIHFEFRVNGSSTTFKPSGNAPWTAEAITAAEARGTPDADDGSWPSTHTAGKNRPARYVKYYQKWFDDHRTEGAPSGDWYGRCRQRLAGKTTKEQINSVIEFEIRDDGGVTLYCRDA